MPIIHGNKEQQKRCTLSDLPFYPAIQNKRALFLLYRIASLSVKLTIDETDDSVLEEATGNESVAESLSSTTLSISGVREGCCSALMAIFLSTMEFPSGLITGEFDVVADRAAAVDGAFVVVSLVTSSIVTRSCCVFFLSFVK